MVADVIQAIRDFQYLQEIAVLLLISLFVAYTRDIIRLVLTLAASRIRPYIPYLDQTETELEEESGQTQRGDNIPREEALEFVVLGIDKLLEGDLLNLEEAYEKLDVEKGPAGFESYPQFGGGFIGNRLPENLHEIFAENHPEIVQKLSTYQDINEQYQLLCIEKREFLWPLIVSSPDLRDSFPDSIEEILPSDLIDLPVDDTYDDSEVEMVPSLTPRDDPRELLSSVGAKDLAKYTLVNEPEPSYVREDWIEECDELNNHVYVDHLFDARREEFLKVRDNQVPDEDLEEMEKHRENMKTLVKDLIDSLREIREDYVETYNISEPELEELSEILDG